MKSAASAFCLVLIVILGGCYSRSETAAACGPCADPCATFHAPAPVVVRRVAKSAAKPAAVAAPAVTAPAAAAPAAAAKPRAAARYGAPGFTVLEEDGRLWVFRSGSDDLRSFLEKGEPAKRVTRIGVGLDDKTVMSSDGEAIDAYVLATRYTVPGFSVEMKGGRLWVFEKGSEALAAYRKHGEPAKRITRIGSGPHDLTVIGPDGETLDAYIAKARYGRPGFATYLVDGRLWVFHEGSKEHQQFRETGEPAKRVTRIGVGPDERSVIAPDGETIDAYMATW